MISTLQLLLIISLKLYKVIMKKNFIKKNSNVFIYFHCNLLTFSFNFSLNELFLIILVNLLNIYLIFNSLLYLLIIYSLNKLYSIFYYDSSSRYFV